MTCKGMPCLVLAYQNPSKLCMELDFQTRCAFCERFCWYQVVRICLEILEILSTIIIKRAIWSTSSCYHLIYFLGFYLKKTWIFPMIHWAEYRLLVVNTCKFSFLLQTAQDSNMYRVWLFLNLTVNYNPQMYITKWM